MVALGQIGWRYRAFRILSLLLAISTLVNATASVLDNGRAVNINGIRYYVGGIAVSKLNGISENELNAAVTPDVDVIPLTIIRTEEAVFTETALQEILSNYTASDDVFQDGFLQGRS